jgi:concanavalin A-like lectin/glucanase superfamily protein
VVRRTLAAISLATLSVALSCATAGAAITHSWPGDGSAEDVVGTADGTLHDNATFAAGLVNQGFSLDGAGDTVTFGDVGDLGTTDFTIAFAIKTTFPGVDEVVLTKRPICGFSSFFDIHEGAGGTLSFEIDGGGSADHTGVGSLDRVDDGIVHTAVITRQGQVVSWFIDGAPSGANDLGSPQDVSNAADLVLGGSPCVSALAATNFTGVVDELRIADAADPNLLAPPAPVNLAGPTIPATAKQGEPLTCEPGSWRYHPSLAFQWLSDGQPIDGATAATYTPTAADVGHSLACRVTGSNAGGSASADSGSVTPAAADVPPPLTTPTPPPPPPPPPPALPPVVTVAPAAVGLPSAKRCVSGRRFVIHLRKIHGERVASAQVFVKGHRVSTVKGRAISAPVDLRGLPKGRFVVRIVVTTVAGKRFAGKRTYRTCAGRRKAHKRPFAA